MTITRRFASPLSFVRAAWFLAACLAFAVPAAAATNGAHTLTVLLSPTGVTPTASGKAKYNFVRASGSLTIETRGLRAGAYDIRISGGVVGTLNVTVDDAAANGISRFFLDSTLSSGILYDPRGTSLEVVNQTSGATELHTDEFPVDKADEQRRVKLTAALQNTGAQPAASGDAEFRSFRGRTKFQVKVAGLSAGSYDLVVGGAPCAHVTINSLDDVTLSFDSLASEVTYDANGVAGSAVTGRGGRGTIGTFLLDFDPRGLPLTLSLAGQSILTINPFPTE